MSSNVNVSLTNIRLTGTNVSLAQRAVDMTITWVDDAGQAHQDTRTVNFPNILTNASLPAGWVQEQLVDLCYRAVRVIVGLDVP